MLQPVVYFLETELAAAVHVALVEEGLRLAARLLGTYLWKRERGRESREQRAGSRDQRTRKREEKREQRK
jgi:hypothetical protein